MTTRRRSAKPAGQDGGPDDPEAGASARAAVPGKPGCGRCRRGRHQPFRRDSPTGRSSRCKNLRLSPRTCTAWLSECGVETVAMESTGVYWIPLFGVLEERGFEVMVVDPRRIKNVPGRKTDVLDCQ